LKKVVYIFSGLGADEKVFRKLDLSRYSPKFIEWIIPLEKESLENYALRLTEQIADETPTFIGLSFGGIMAIEVAKLISPGRIILLSSAKSRHEIPFHFRLIGKLRLHRLIPARMLMKPNPLTYWFFGASSVSDKQLLEQILLETNPKFFKWAIDKILCWSNTMPHEKIIHIHGTADRLLPYCNISCDFPVRSGGHFMILNKADIISKMLIDQLDK
jgi:hypothetical protein